VQEAYRALHDLKRAGQVQAVGVGAKDWRVIRALADAVELDWVMLACSFTVYRHAPDLLAFVDHLHRRGTGIINSAVFNAGFLIGGRYFDYRVPDPSAPADQPLFAWREAFLARCREHGVDPAAACVQFGLSAPGIAAVALNTGKPAHVRRNVDLVAAELPGAFWSALKRDGLIDKNYLHLG
jgi:D-threo-aldose 1-dehydrogenase